MPGPAPLYFVTPETFGAWLAKNHATRVELIVGFWKVGSGKPSMTWPQAIEQAIAYGWIDGVRYSLDAASYTVRFTPRKPTSTWSLANVATAERLIAAGRMTPTGLAAFKARKANRTGIYAAEQHVDPALAPTEAKALKADAKAWAWFSARAPSYQKAAKWWIVSAKKQDTRRQRLEQLIACSHAGRPVPPLTPRPGKG